MQKNPKVEILGAIINHFEVSPDGVVNVQKDGSDLPNYLTDTGYLPTQILTALDDLLKDKLVSGIETFGIYGVDSVTSAGRSYYYSLGA